MATSIQNPDDHRKLALIIGNDDYRQRQNRLVNSASNAKELSNKLETINFKVTTACNLNKNQMTTAIIDFSKTIRNGDLVLVYFSGHGYQVKDKNYLMPVDDDRIESDRDVEDFATDIEQMFSRLVKRNLSYVTILILDCCRPYALKGASGASSMGEGTGLQEMKASDGTFIQFAGAANQTVSNELFAKHLLRNITQENVDIGDMFRRIADDVYQESSRRQRPFSTNGLHQHKQVYLNRNDVSTARFLSNTPLSEDEKNYFEDCKEYYRLTGEPLISVADEVFDDHTDIPSTSIKFGINEECNKFDLGSFLSKICSLLNLQSSDITMKRIQTGSSIVEADIFNRSESKNKKVGIRMMVHRLTDRLRKELAKMKVFFAFMGPITSLFNMQKHRAEIKLNPRFNRTYSPRHVYWDGALHDGKNRGNQPYYCPVGWQRWSFYVTSRFDQKFNGWCISYHGTKFAYGLSILLSGLKPAERAEHGAGVYTTPSIKYVCHPRYAEVKRIQSSSSSKFFKSGKYVQFVLECRVQPKNILKIREETLDVGNTVIDPNINNQSMEWVIDHQNKDLVDFNDPNASIVCTGILTRVTDKHPGLLPESDWWFRSHLCNSSKCCLLDIDRDSLEKQRQNGDTCDIIFH